MPKNSYASEINHAEVMSSGLTNHVERIAKRGIQLEFIEKLNTNTREAIELNNQQEKLKAELKQKTAELDAKMNEIKKATAEARKLVKIEFPQAQWREFGIEATR